MDRVRRARPPVAGSPELKAALGAIRRVRTAAPVVQEPEEEEVHEDLNESPDTRGDDESAQEAGDRIEAKYKARATSPLRAIRAFCVICVGCYPREVAKCTATECVLHPFRYGTNPYQRRGGK